ncbi:MAG: DUF6062 family protein [Clostridia bacterium]|nr:DUF6062 family protein [Clostridia bacterium]
MKETIYTIPISEAFHEKDGCPFCRLYSECETQSLDFALGGAMMEPHERTLSNELGFCEKHYNGLRSLSNRLSLGLMTTTHLDELLDTVLSEDFITGKAFINPRMNPQKYKEQLKKTSSTCYVCDHIENVMKHYYTNTVHMWKSDPEFRALFLEQEYFCLPHLMRLVSAAEEKLFGKKAFQEFLSEALPISRRYVETLRDDANAFCLSFDHRNAGKPLSPEARSAIERSSIFLNGTERNR